MDRQKIVRDTSETPCFCPGNLAIFNPPPKEKELNEEALKLA
jgi:hypothetical protein